MVYDITNEKEDKLSDDNIHCKIKTKFKVFDLKLNYKYLRIILIAVSNNVELFEIPEIPNQDKITNPKFIFKENKSMVNCALFNPYNSHIIASSSFDYTIKIWSLRKPSIQNIDCLDIPEKMKWDSNGKLLGFIDEEKIKIYSTKNKKIIFDLQFSGRISNINYEFYDHQNIIVNGNEINKIFKYKFIEIDDSEVETKHKVNTQYDEMFEIKQNLLFMCNDYFILYSEEGVHLFSDDFSKPIYKFKNLSNNPKVIINTDENILFQIVDINKNEIKILIFKDKCPVNVKNTNQISNLEDENSTESKYDSEDNYLEDTSQNYFENCPQIFLDIKENLNFRFNIFPENYDKKAKKYFGIKEIKESLDNIKVHNLISLRKIVKEELLKKISLKTIKDTYFYYLLLLIKDETNKDLLLKYLKFLKENEAKLDEENLMHEKFTDELIYYSIFFEEEEFKKLFNFDKISEKKKLLNLLSDYSSSIEKKSLEELKETVGKEYIERKFNQPLHYNSKEIIYYRCKVMLIENILYDKIKKENEETELANKNYIIKEILEKDLINKLESLDKLLPLISLISYSEDKRICDFYINLVNSEIIPNSILNEKVKKFGYKLFKNDGKSELIALGELYENPEELCIENIGSKYKKCEKYNYDFLIKNPPLKLEVNKTKEFLITVFSSNVFKEAFEYLTGNKKYEEIFNKEMIIEYVNKIKFLPINYSRTSAFIDSLSLVTFIPTFKKNIANNLSKELDEIIIKTLENSVIIEIIYHEFGHAINSVISFIENNLKSIGTPRKKYLKFKEGGYYFELTLFGKIIKNLLYGEALYILNINNYNKNLDDFKNGFQKLSIEDLKIKGFFENLNLNNEQEIESLKTEINIKAKLEEKEDILRNIKINIPPKNDILNREIKEEDLKIYY